MEILYAIFGGLFIALVIIYFKYYRKIGINIFKNKNNNEKKVVVETTEIEKPKMANCWVVSEKDIWFEYREDAPGQLYPCSDGMSYYHLTSENSQINELMMPDEGEYSVPADLYGEALKMPACKAYLAMQDTLMQKISAAVIVVIIIAECIAFAFVG